MCIIAYSNTLHIKIPQVGKSECGKVAPQHCHLFDILAFHFHVCVFFHFYMETHTDLEGLDQNFWSFRCAITNTEQITTAAAAAEWTGPETFQWSCTAVIEDDCKASSVSLSFLSGKWDCFSMHLGPALQARFPNLLLAEILLLIALNHILIYKQWACCLPNVH